MGILSPGRFKLSNLFKESLIYGMSSYVWIIAATLLTPVYTRLLSKAEYGYMDIYNTWIAFAVLLVPLGLVQCIARLWIDVKHDAKATKNLTGSIQAMILLMFAVLLLVSFVGKAFFEATILKSDLHGEIYWLSLFIVFGQLELSLQLELLKVRFKKWAYAAVALTNFLLLSSLGFVFVYFNGWGIKGFYIASIIGLYSSLLGSLYLNRAYLSLAFDWKLILQHLRYSVFFVLVLLFFGISNIIDRFILNQYLSIEEVGIYNIASKLAAILLLIGNSFSAAWFPRAFDKIGKADETYFFRQVHRKFLLLTSLVFLMVVLFRKELLLFFAPDYFEAYNTIVLLAAFNLVNGLGPIFAIGIHVKKRSYFLAIAAVISIGINVGLSILLVKDFGIAGIATGTLAGGLFWTGLRLFFSQRLYKTGLRFGIYAILLPIILLGLAAAYSVDLLEISTWKLLSVKLSLATLLTFLFLKLYNHFSSKIVEAKHESTGYHVVPQR